MTAVYNIFTILIKKYDHKLYRYNNQFGQTFSVITQLHTSLQSFSIQNRSFLSEKFSGRPKKTAFYQSVGGYFNKISLVFQIYLRP